MWILRNLRQAMLSPNGRSLHGTGIAIRCVGEARPTFWIWILDCRLELAHACQRMRLPILPAYMGPFLEAMASGRNTFTTAHVKRAVKSSQAMVLER